MNTYLITVTNRQGVIFWYEKFNSPLTLTHTAEDVENIHKTARLTLNEFAKRYCGEFYVAVHSAENTNENTYFYHNF